jgi:lipoyl(octanoyl) transferase
MKRAKEVPPRPPESDLSLQAYLLGQVDVEALLHVQRFLHFEICGQRDHGALILCEHPPFVSVGRHGSRAHLAFDAAELPWRSLPVRWTPRGGGCWLHLPGQLAIYAIFPLDRLGLKVHGFVERLGHTIAAVLGDFDIKADVQAANGGVFVGRRMAAGLGVAVRDWVSAYGACLNIEPDLVWYRSVRCAGADEPMTSLARERRGRVRPSLVRERLVEHCQSAFGFSRLSLFTDHKLLHGVQERCRPKVGSAK